MDWLLPFQAPEGWGHRDASAGRYIYDRAELPRSPPENGDDVLEEDKMQVPASGTLPAMFLVPLVAMLFVRADATSPAEWSSALEAVERRVSVGGLRQAMVSDRVRTAGHLFPLPGLPQQAFVAFHRALTACARARLTGR